MVYWILALLLVACYGIYYYFKKRLKYFEQLGIPYLPGWPLLGIMAEPLMRRKHFIDVVTEMYNVDLKAKYVGTFEFMNPVIVLRDLELIKSVAIKNFDNFPDRTALIDDKLDPLFGGNLFNMSGDRWREVRNLITPAFTSSKMKGMFDLMVECGKNFVDHLSERDQKKNEMVATKELFTRYTNDVIASCAFGVSVNSLKDPKNDFYVLGRQATNFAGLRSLKFFAARAMPWFLKLFKLRLVDDHIREFFEDVVEQTICYRDKHGINRPDMLQLMMNARENGDKSVKMSITEMTAQLFIFFFGGFETTSTQMCAIAHELVLNPDIQSRLQSEIDDVMNKTDGKPTYEAINAMPYIDAVFNESLRLHTQVPFADRSCVRSFELPPSLPGGKPFTIEPGMNIWIPSAAIHRDPEYYEDPLTFNPDRYYQKKITINDVTNLAFGIGPRSCIGNRFGILETKILFFFLLSKFDLKSNAKTSKSSKYDKSSLTLMPEGGFWLDIIPRS